MKVRDYFVSFHRTEAGAVTVDWVVLTAALVALCLAIFFTLGEGATLALETMFASVGA